jgi:membrane associated rhomboid family serine protease
VYGLWSFGAIEPYLGTLSYLRYSFLMLIGSELLMLLATWISFTWLRRERERQTYTVGYSGVVFGWMAVCAILIPVPWPIFGVNIPAWIVPFLFLAITQFLIPNASFLGHLAGIIIGFAIGGGAFEWFNEYLFLCGFIWSVEREARL